MAQWVRPDWTCVTGISRSTLSVLGSHPGSGWDCCWGCEALGDVGAGEGEWRLTRVCWQVRTRWTPEAWTDGICWRCRAKRLAEAVVRRVTTCVWSGRSLPPHLTAQTYCHNHQTHIIYLPELPRCRQHGPGEMKLISRSYLVVIDGALNLTKGSWTLPDKWKYKWILWHLVNKMECKINMNSSFTFLHPLLFLYSDK